MAKFVSKADIGKYVISAGWIDLDLEPRAPAINETSLRIIPPGLRMLLRGLEAEYAYLYRDGVIRVPAVLLEPWER